jgi:type II secretory pathway component PulC
MRKFVFSIFIFLPAFCLAELKDPTRPIYSETEQPNLIRGLGKKIVIGKIQLIYSSEESKFVLIDGKRYSEGESVKHYKIKKINKNDIVIFANGKEKTLPLYSGKR